MGKASKHRDCPALGRDISVADCGSGRHSTIACTAECAHNPFAPANYERMLEIETRLDGQTLSRLAADPSNGASLLPELNKAARMGPHAENAFMVRRIFFDRDTNGATFAQRWERSGWQGLKNDESALMRGKMQMHVTLLEVHRVLPDGWLEFVDLLSAKHETFRLRDNSLSKRAVRFTTLLAWIYPAPHFWRTSGTAILMPSMALLPADDIVREIVRHLGGPPEEIEMRRWLAGNFQRVDDALLATAQTRHTDMLANIDANLGQAVYELQKTPSECRRRLDSLSEVQPDDISANEKSEGFTAARVWFDTQAKPVAGAGVGGQIILGRVLLGKKRWRAEATGAERLSRLRKLFETRMGERVRFVSELQNNFALRESLKSPVPDASLVPPRLLENPTKILLQSSCVAPLPAGMSPRDYERKMREDADRAFLDDNIPALDNNTPRHAAANPLLRPRLIQMMKERVHALDEANLKSGREDSMDWMLRELGLHEIMFEAPPRRNPPDTDMHDDNEGDDDNDNFISMPARAFVARETARRA